MTEDAEDSPRQHVRRKKNWQDWITTTGGVIAIVGSIAAGVAWTIGILPFVRTDVYSADLTRITAQVSGLESMSKDNATQLTDIKRNGLLNLQLNLQSRVELLGGVMDGIPRGGSTWLGLAKERDTTQQQLDETKRELSR